MDAHFHGHDGVLLLAEYSFAEITLRLKNQRSVMIFGVQSTPKIITLRQPYPRG
jgi:hypothetical protein